MKELTRLEMASVKRAFQTTKHFRTKKAKLIEKINSLQQDVKALDDMIEMWETPIRKITGGYTSEEVMNGNTETASVDYDPNLGCVCPSEDETPCSCGDVEECPKCCEDPTYTPDNTTMGAQEL
jgi:hypothetical protein